ncbi:ComEC/Rec2 family competence protein [Actinomyces radicidentis]|uniref:ComEC/Rec2 family competence protein n=1 Tax=Actinomyces radicidentis TaxID=111015 RepID=UPI0028E6A84E|nr:ComEC/Rec2 family competence protein [Actinomyces radicidentis]
MSALPAPWDRPGAVSAGGAEERRRRRAARRRAHGSRERAPEALDLRLAPAGLCAWAAALVSVAAPRWEQPAAAAAACLGTGLLIAPRVMREHLPRHRRDDRPGADAPDASTVGTVLAGVLACLLCAAAVLAVTAVGVAGRARDPVALAAADGAPVTLIGTVTTTPRVIASTHSTLVLTELDVASVDGAGSRLSVTVLGGEDWLDADMGTTVRARGSLEPADTGAGEGALLGGRASVRVLEEPRGLLGLVTLMRQGLADAVGREPPARAVGGWPEGTRALVPGVALGDDHALPGDVRTDMRAVSMTHLTAVSGQHVAIVLGLVLTGLGVLPRRVRAVLGAGVLAALVVLVRPGGSVLRAATMGAVMLTGVAVGRRSAAVPAMCAGVVVLLLVDPWQARDYGFVLSVAATAGILLASRPATVALSRHLPRWLAVTLALPLVAQATCAPVLILLQPSVGLWAVPANVLAAPPVPVATVCGLVAALLAPLWPGAAAVVAWPATASCAWLVLVARFFARLPGATIAWPGGVGGALLLAAVEAVVAAASSRRVRHRVLRTWRRRRRAA